MILCIGFSSGLTQAIKVGAKHFNEGYLLAEILAQILESGGYSVERTYNLGGTLICYEALNNSEIDLYPEYTGTISEQILHLDKKISWSELRDSLKTNLNLNISVPYGFNNTYALAIRRDLAKSLAINCITDLRNKPNLKFAFSYEFLKRNDGWENLAIFYNLPQSAVGIEHGLAYQALNENSVDVIDVYSTDGEIPRYDLKILRDDRDFFPVYQAVTFYRADLDTQIVNMLSVLNNAIDEKTMQKLNAAVVLDGLSHNRVARTFLAGEKIISTEQQSELRNVWRDILNKTGTHLNITFFALVAAIFIAIPLGILVYQFGSLTRPVLYFVGLLQTIPSIALLAFMIPLFGIGVIPAMIALFLYALLPILRNTATALFTIDPLLKKVATGIGLTRWQRMYYIEFPLAVPNILAGIKTAAVINIGTATLAAFIGAGGLGEYIVTGLALNNTSLILRGAIPAALLAILIEFLFEIFEKLVIPKHMQQTLAK
jgi:osmoprotectant transport system permease protein